MQVRMPKKRPSNELLNAVTSSTIAELRDIDQLYVSRHHEDAMSAVGEGAVFLAVASVKDDQDGDGFRYLIGLKRGTKVTPHLTCFFERR